MIKVLIPLVALIAVFVGLIAIEPPPTQEQLDEKQRRELFRQFFESEPKQLLEQLVKLERKETLMRSTIQKMEKAKADHPRLRESLDRVQEEERKKKEEAEKAIAGVYDEQRNLERKATEFLRTAYNLTPDALPPGYLARVLWKVDGTAITDTAKLAKELRAKLHISETAAQKAGLRLSRLLKSRYTRRTVVSAAAALATLAVLESAEPFFDWVFKRWWKFLVAVAASLIALIGIVLLQKRKVFD